jgi:hypothetical protein
MERVGDRQEKMEGYCSTGQSPQRAVVSVENKSSNGVHKKHLTSRSAESICE